MDPSSSAIIGCRAAAHCRGGGGSSPKDLEIGDEALRDFWRHFADAFNAIGFRNMTYVHACLVQKLSAAMANRAAVGAMLRAPLLSRQLANGYGLNHPFRLRRPTVVVVLRPTPS